MMKIQEEVNNHLKTYHSEIVEAYDPDSFVSDSDYHQEFLDFLCAGILIVTILFYCNLWIMGDWPGRWY